MAKKITGAFRRISNYMKSHFSAQVTGSVLLLLFLAGMILQSYVKNQYFDFLLKETRRTEESVLGASAKNMNNVLASIVNTSCTIALDEALRTAVDDAKNSGDIYGSDGMFLKTELQELNYSGANVAALAIVTENGLLMEYGRYWTKTLSDFWQGDNLEVLNVLYEDVMRRTKETGIVRYNVSTWPICHPNLPDMPLYHVAVPLVGKSSQLDTVDAVVVLSFRLNEVFEMHRGTADGNETEITQSYVIDRDGIIICHENEKYVGYSVENYRKEMQGNEDLSYPLEYFGWQACKTIDIANMQDEVDRLYTRSIFVYIVLLFACGILWQGLLRKVLRPLGTIREAMQKIQLGDHMERIEVKGSHEVWQLAEHYNKMTDKLEEQRQQIRQHYKDKTRSIEQRNKAEREALEAQINAHFLCNTLTAINYDAVENGDHEVAARLKMLSSILSYTFSRKHVTVTLGQEIQWVEQYLSLQKFRLMEVFDYEINFPQEYGEWPCCKLFLQPFVENSILHGFEGREHGGKIQIEGTIVEDRFVLKVRDNGCGMERQTEAVIQEILKNTGTLELDGTGIGIQNVVTRLRMYYGKGLDIRLETAEGAGTCFTFWLPIPENPVEHPEYLE